MTPIAPQRNDVQPEATATPDSSAVPVFGTRKRAWTMTGLVVFLYIVNYADKAVLGIIAQPLARELGLKSSQIGMVGSLFFLMFCIGGFLAGPLNKYLTLRWALLILAAIWSVVMLPLVLGASLAMLIVSRMLLGFAEGPSSALMHTAAYSWHPPAKRGLPGAMLAGSASVAKIALAPVLTFIAVHYGWRAAVLSLSVLGLVWMGCWLAGWSEGPYTSKAVKATKTADTEATEAAGTATKAVTEPNVPWRKILLSRTFVSCCFLIATIYALTTVVLTWLPSYFEVGLGYSAMQAGSMFALPSIVGLVLMITSGSVTDKLIGRGFTSRTVRVIVPCVGVLICGSILLFLPQISTPHRRCRHGLDRLRVLGNHFPAHQRCDLGAVPAAADCRNDGILPRHHVDRWPDCSLRNGSHRGQRCNPGRRLRPVLPGNRRHRSDRRGSGPRLRQSRARSQAHPRLSTPRIAIR